MGILRAMSETYRIGEAAEHLGVRVETLRRWEREGKLRTERTSGGQRLVPAAEVARLLAERRPERPIAAVSRRNAFPGVITKVVKDRVSATVEIQAGPHRVLALITREAADEMGLAARDGGHRDREGDQRDGRAAAVRPCGPRPADPRRAPHRRRARRPAPSPTSACSFHWPPHSILVNGLDAGSVLVCAGLLVIAAGSWFKIPFPVQPLKALTAVAVARELSPDVIHAAGLELGRLPTPALDRARRRHGREALRQARRASAPARRRRRCSSSRR